MYGVDVKEAGGRGFDLNVHWTLKIFFFDLSTPPSIDKLFTLQRVNMHYYYMAD